VPFRPIRTTRGYIHVAEQILQAITSGEYPPGSQLPQERSLAVMLGVSRATVREGLTALEVLGFVQTNPGQGTFVRHSTGAREGMLQLAGASMDEVLVTRQILEKAVVELLCTKDVDLSPVAQNIEGCIAAHQAGQVKEFLDLGLAFHSTLAECTGNSILYRMTEELMTSQDQPLVRLLNLNALYLPQNREKHIREHQEIYSALLRQDVAGTIQLVEGHLCELRRIINTSSEE
jgi:GntR family transcriptional repressor for pyruvate dehydrogenase complex